MTGKDFCLFPIFINSEFAFLKLALLSYSNQIVLDQGVELWQFGSLFFWVFMVRRHIQMKGSPYNTVFDAFPGKTLCQRTW